MATYKGIQGYTVQKLSTDPTASEAGGQLWYNSTSGAFKLGTQGAGAWASGGVLSSPRGEGTGAGTQTAGIAMGGRLVPGSGATVVDVTETYNGTSWTEVNNLTSARRSLSSAKQGTTTASLVFGGDATGSPTFRDLTESYNGTSWSEGGDLTLEIESGAGAGTQTAALSFGGGTNPEPTMTTNMQSWDGTSWTNGNSLNTGRNRLGGTGTTTAALAFGGQTPSATDITEQWNGTSWAEVNDLNSARATMGSGGTSTAAISMGGSPFGGLTEIWDGTSWTEVADLATGIHGSAGSGGTSGGAFLAGGFSDASTAPTATEVWNDPVYTIKTVTVS